MERESFAIVALLAACSADGSLATRGEENETDTAVAVEGSLCANPQERAAGPYQRYDWPGQYPASSDDLAGNGVAIADLDGDGVLDVVLPNPNGSQLWMGRLNSEVPGGYELIDESAKRIGLNIKAVTATAVDYDTDGDLDLFLGNSGPNDFAENDGKGVFTLIGAQLGVTGGDYDTSAGTFADMDSDGDLDLAVANYVSIDGNAPTNQLLLFDADAGVYKDATDHLEDDVARRAQSFGFSFMDIIPHNGSPELFLYNEKGSGDGLLVYEHRDGKYTPIADSYGLNFFASSMGLGLADSNMDGEPDFAISAYGKNHLLVSGGGGTWYDASLSMGDIPGEAQTIGWGGLMRDLDNDGDLDKIVNYGPHSTHPESPDLQVQVNSIQILGSDGRFQDMAPSWGMDDMGAGRGAMAADLNQDGYLDIVRRNVTGPATLDLSKCGSNSWLFVRLEDVSGLNRSGVGSKIQVDVGDITYTSWLFAGGDGYASSGPQIAHFGLGSAAVIDKLTVTRPSGEVQELYDVEPFQVLTVSHD